MKKIYLFLLIFIVIILRLHSEEFSYDELFQQGNSLYKEGNYEEAIEKYRIIESQGIINGSLYYNIGNSYFKIGKLGYAILFYERARKYLPRDREVLENLVFVQSFTQDNIEERKPTFLIYLLYRILIKLSFKEILILASTLFSILMVCSIFFILRRNLIIIKNLTISFLVIFLISALLLFVKVNLENTKAGVILLEVVNVKSGPSEESTLEFVIHEGTKFQVLEFLNEWAKIRFQDGKAGWVTTDTFELI
jgi:tetratricopeptide (TPR) repeat protein